MKNVIIVGASHAAVEAISTLRKAGWEEKITLIGDEGVLPYHRPPLSKGYLAGDVSDEKLAIRNPDFYAKANVDLMLGCRVESIDRRSNEVVLSDGTRIGYSKLILATGTRARYLPVEGGDFPQVKYLRTRSDVDAIKEQIKPNAKLLIVGAGYIGLEVAASATKLGMNVTVVEAMERVLARVTSPVVSEFYQKLHQQAGVDIRVEAQLEKFVSDVTGVHALLADGTEIAFDCALIGIGVVPNVELAEDAGLACENGILVDALTRTEDDDIYAVGDCSNHPSRIYGRRIRLESVPNANEQAKTAAMDICGIQKPYDQVPWFWSDQYDIKLQTAGLLTDYDQAIVRGDISARKFTVFYLAKGTLIAVDAINSPAEFMVSKKLVSNGIKADVEVLADVTVPLKNILGETL